MKGMIYVVNLDFDSFVKEQKKHKPNYLGNNTQTKKGSNTMVEQKDKSKQK